MEKGDDGPRKLPRILAAFWASPGREKLSIREEPPVLAIEEPS